MTYLLRDIADLTGLPLIGDGDVVVVRAAEPGTAQPGDLALAMSSRYADALTASSAEAAVVWPDADITALGLRGALVATRARAALAHVTSAFQHPVDLDPGIHPTAVIGPGAQIGPDAWIGAFTVIGAGAIIGRGARIANHVSIGREARIGEQALLHPGVRIGARCVAGDRLIVHQNAVIGADGFSFEPPERSQAMAARGQGEGAVQATSGFLRIHSLAAVEIGDDVEIGAATTLDRGTIAPTRIGSGTKIDNQVQIGHNVQIGQTCLICAQTGIAGSTRLGDRVVLGGKTGIADHLQIGSDVVCAAGTMVAGHIRGGQVMMGVPAVPREQATRQFMAMRRMPRVMTEIAEIRRKLGL